MKPIKEWRIGTALALYALTLAFVLSFSLKDSSPFTVTAPVVVGGKWLENFQERRRRHKESPE